MHRPPTTRTASLAPAFVAAVVLCVLTATGPATARQARDVEEPDVAARAWVLTDLKSGDVLAGEDASKEFYP